MITAWGVDSPARLAAFFAARRQKYIVLRTADLLRLEAEDCDRLGAVLAFMGVQAGDQPPTREQLQTLGAPLGGYVRLPTERVSSLSMGQLAEVALLISAVEDIRINAGYPFLTRACECGGGQPCKLCDSTGVVRVLDTMTDRERALSEGKEGLDGHP